MSKGLDALNKLKHCINDTHFNSRNFVDIALDVERISNTLEKELKALEVIKNNFRLVGNCLHAKNPYAEDGWVFVKEIEDEEELDAWKEVLE